MNRRLLFYLARLMRREQTTSEDILWKALRSRRVDGVKFRRQQVIDRFIVDFFAPSHRLVIEVDGPSHRGREEHDENRDYVLIHEFGLRVLRFKASDVERHLDRVVNAIRDSLQDKVS